MMMKLSKILICVVVVILTTVLQNLINGKKNRRARQVLFPSLAILYCVIAVGYGHQYLDELAFVTQFIDYIRYIDVAIVNGALLIGFLVVKLVLTPTVTRFCGGKDFLQEAAGAFYAYDDDYEEWFLLHKWMNFRQYLFAISCGMTVITGVYAGLMWVVGKESWLWNMALPAAALIVVNEIYNFINGQTKEEFEHSIYGDQADARRISNYYKVREVFEQILPEPLLSAHTGYEYAGKQTAVDLMKEWKESDDKIDVVTAEYFEMRDRYKTADIDCVQATLQLMHRNNVVFFNPFYRDLAMYITLPLVNSLLSGKKCVVITGRLSNCEDVQNWLSDVLSKYSHMKSMWRVEILSDKEPECEVGILSFPQLYENKVIATNREFFRETDFVLLIEPSLIVNTGQIALSIIAQEMRYKDEGPVYCICDRNTEGLVDTLSHVLHADITNVVAPPVPRCIYTGMSWDADGDFIRQQLFDKQTRYLGNGIELAAIAVKNQIPHVSWYCETKAPIKDIKWIAGQQHPTICRYMNLPAQQKSLYEKIEFISNLWNTSAEREKFLIVEDEFCNMFSTMRAYLSRGTNQSFVNVMSENYLLRDYMRCNRQMFMSNPGSIPSIVPDYAKTERNTLIKLLLLMSLRPVTDSEVIDEFHLVGIETEDAFDTLTKMLEKYTFVDNTIFTIQSVRTNAEQYTTSATCKYSITKEAFDHYFADSLKNAYFILEEEKHEEGFIDAKLFSHVTQIVLPGQFVTYDGKYYMVKHVSPQSGVVLRRASDLYDGRKYYRQIREYTLNETVEPTILSLKTVMDIEISYVQRDFTVQTTGYLDMRDNHDLRLARMVDFSEDPSVDNYTRRYHNKTMLRIKLPDTNDKIRFTICLLLAEVFKSVFPDGWPYLAVVAKRPDDIDGMLNYLVHPVNGEIEDEYIYIIEDSDIDLGLIEAVEKNLMKLMEIVTDFLEWHFEKMREPAPKDPPPVSINYNAKKEVEKKRNLFQRMADRINKVFGIKKVEDVKVDTTEKVEQKAVAEGTEYSLDEAEGTKKPDETKIPDATEQPDDTGKVTVASEKADDVSKETVSKTYKEDEFLPSSDEDPEIAPVDGTDIFDESSDPEHDEDLEREFERVGITPIEKTRYQRECFLKFGYEEIDGRLELDTVHKYLRVRTWSNSSLTKARKRDILAKTNLDMNAVNQCDFCGLPLNGVSYDVLNDGRVRCNDCSSSAISTVDELRKMFFQTLDMMEAIYGVRYRVPIAVGMTDARKIAKGYGSVFKPSTEFAARVVGYAQRKWGKYSLWIENGSPRLATLDTMVHEMTHIWQYLNWDDNAILNTYKMSDPGCTRIARDIVYEGMAMWSSIQYLYQIGETYYAAQQEALAEQRTDVYGIGFRLYCEQYPIVKDSSLIVYSPFTQFPTLEPEKVTNAVRSQCKNPKCRC